MADIQNKQPGNVDGIFFTDSQCIDSDLCRQTAPNNFKRDDEGGFSFVAKQPETDEERKLCDEAKDACPVEAIGTIEVTAGVG